MGLSGVGSLDGDSDNLGVEVWDGVGVGIELDGDVEVFGVNAFVGVLAGKCGACTGWRGGSTGSTSRSLRNFRLRTHVRPLLLLMMYSRVFLPNPTTVPDSTHFFDVGC